MIPFVELMDYDCWANHRVLDAAARLTTEQLLRPLGSSFTSVRDTLVHVLFAEWLWLERWEGRSPRDVFEPAAYPTVAAIAERWAEVEARRSALLARWVPGVERRRQNYVNARGERWEYSLGEMMQHLVIHSAYHRGQVVTMLRQLQAEAPATDYLVYVDGRGEAASER